MSDQLPGPGLFFSGINESDQGNYEAAAMFYKKALD